MDGGISGWMSKGIKSGNINIFPNSYSLFLSWSRPGKHSLLSQTSQRRVRTLWWEHVSSVRRTIFLFSSSSPAHPCQLLFCHSKRESRQSVISWLFWQQLRIKRRSLPGWLEGIASPGDKWLAVIWDGIWFLRGSQPAVLGLSWLRYGVFAGNEVGTIPNPLSQGQIRALFDWRCCAGTGVFMHLGLVLCLPTFE